MYKKNQNKKILLSAVITAIGLAALSAGILVSSSDRQTDKKAVNAGVQISDLTYSSQENVLTIAGNNNVEVIADESVAANGNSETIVGESMVANNSSEAVTEKSVSSENSSEATASGDFDAPEGKLIPEIESSISGARVDKLIPEPDEEDTASSTDATSTNGSSTGKKNSSAVGSSALTTDADFSEVSGSYFDDAVFIGNSRTEGLMLYTTISGIDLAYTGLNVSTAYTTPAVKVNGKKVPVMEALKSKTFSKAYIMFGVNEVGWMSADTFISYYRQIIQDVRAVNPDAIVYVQSMLPVTAAFEKERGDITNAKIAKFNKRLKALADEQGAIFLNIAEVIADSNGELPSNASPDGYHLNQVYCEKWYSYLKSHAIVN